MAKESAASRAAKIERQHLVTTAATGIHTFKHLGVTVWGGKVYKGTGLARNELGDLAGACAGVLETRRVAPMAGLFSGVPPRLGTAFVQCSNGRRKQVEGREGYVTNRSVVWAQFRQEIRDFNRLADAASPPPSDRQQACRAAEAPIEVEQDGVKAELIDGTMIIRGLHCPKDKQHAPISRAQRCPGGSACTGEPYPGPPQPSPVECTHCRSMNPTHLDRCDHCGAPIRLSR